MRMCCPHQHLATSRVPHCRIRSTARILVPVLPQPPLRNRQTDSLRLYNTPYHPRLPGTPALRTPRPPPRPRRRPWNRPLPWSTRRLGRLPRVYAPLQPWPLRIFPRQTMRARSQTVGTTLVRQWLCLDAQRYSRQLLGKAVPARGDESRAQI